jgi:hypothetical protein
MGPAIALSDCAPASADDPVRREARTIGGVEIMIRSKPDDIFVIKKKLDVNDRIVFGEVRQVHDRETVE